MTFQWHLVNSDLAVERSNSPSPPKRYAAELRRANETLHKAIRLVPAVSSDGVLTAVL